MYEGAPGGPGFLSSTGHPAPIMKDAEDWMGCASFGHFNVDGGPPDGAFPLYMQPDTLEEYGVPKIDDEICYGWVDLAKVKQESQDKGAMCDWDPVKASLFAITEGEWLIGADCASSQTRVSIIAPLGSIAHLVAAVKPIADPIIRVSVLQSASCWFLTRTRSSATTTLPAPLRTRPSGWLE